MENVYSLMESPKPAQRYDLTKICNAWSYLRLVAYGFLGLSRGHRVASETRVFEARA